MKNYFCILLFAIGCIVLCGCNSCSQNNTDTSYLDIEDEYEYDDDDESELIETTDDAMNQSVDVTVPANVSLEEIGREVYSDLVQYESYGIGGAKLCAEMSADREGKWTSSFSQSTNITFKPPTEINLHQIKNEEGSSNIICRILNGEIFVSVGNVQSDIFRLSDAEPPFIIDILADNNTNQNLPVIIPLGQMLEIQAPNVQNIVICNTYSGNIEPNQSKVFKVQAYCVAQQRRTPRGYPAKLTPFILTVPQWAYTSQQSLWDALNTKSSNDKFYTITFYAWGRGDYTGNGRSKFGHAFVNIPEIGTVGFGLNKEEAKDLFMVHVEGNLFDHARLEQYATYKVEIKINEYSLQKAKEKYYEWKNDSIHYTLGLYDCTAFVMDIAQAADIYFGPRWLIQTPVGFIKELKVYN